MPGGKAPNIRPKRPSQAVLRRLPFALRRAEFTMAELAQVVGLGVLLWCGLRAVGSNAESAANVQRRRAAAGGTTPAAQKQREYLGS